MTLSKWSEFFLTHWHKQIAKSVPGKNLFLFFKAQRLRIPFIHKGMMIFYFFIGGGRKNKTIVIGQNKCIQLDNK
jgi:hypothetical protein